MNNKLKDFVENKMRMSHIYQPLFIKELVKSNGKVNLEDVAKAFLSYDKSQIEYYEYITKTMPSKILKKHGIIEQNKKEYILSEQYSNLSHEEASELIKLCDSKINTYLEKRLDTYDHRKRNYSNLSGSTRYKIIKRAGGRCEACGISSEERAIDVDHIIPRNKGGSDDESNLQALCYKCNRQKKDTDSTNFEKIKNSYSNRDTNCLFCNLNKKDIQVIAENELAIAFYDGYPVTKYHTLIIPKRHVSDYFELHQPEQNAINELLKQQREKLQKMDNSITGFNVGINIGEDSGQTIFHVHVHLIPRRKDDMDDPKGGVRGVIPEKQKY
ncbi:HIT domain-containing protein [Halarcobacter sp.]|uniref:HIT domain-containing protein n=1 Tax=Halarcobacter sp. TaxID=2321133 RepID=UPI003A91204A